MMRAIQLAVACVVVLFATAGNVQAGIIIQPVAVASANAPDFENAFFGDFALNQLIDQSGLSASYASGVTDFSVFTSTTTANNLQESIGGRRTPFPVNFDFDLGAVYSVDAVALWSQGGTAAIRDFTLFADTASDFSGATNLGNFAAGEGSVRLADVFSFGPINARFLRVQATSNFGFGESVRFNEFAASGASVASVPEPLSLAMFGIGACVMGVGAARRRRGEKQQEATA